MKDWEIEELRAEMIIAFRKYVQTSDKDQIYRDETWDAYCDFREAFLKADCARKGLDYLALKDQIKEYGQT